MPLRPNFESILHGVDCFVGTRRGPDISLPPRREEIEDDCNDQTSHSPPLDVGGVTDSLNPSSAAESCQPSQDHNQQKGPLILPGPKEVSFRGRSVEGVMGPGVNFTNLAKYKAADLGIIYGFCWA